MQDELDAYNAELGLCAQCGGPREVCEDAERDWFPHFTVCEITMARRGALELYALRHKDAQYHDGWRTSWAKERSASHPFHWSDGLSVGVSSVDMDPEGEWLPVVVSPHEGAGNEEQGD